MPIFATDLMIRATVYIDAVDATQAKQRAAIRLGTRDDPIQLDLAAMQIPIIDGIELDPQVTAYSPRRATIDATDRKEP